MAKSGFVKIQTSISKEGNYEENSIFTDHSNVCDTGHSF